MDIPFTYYDRFSLAQKKIFGYLQKRTVITYVCVMYIFWYNYFTYIIKY